MSVQTIDATATKLTETSTLIKLLADHPSLSEIAVRVVIDPDVPHGLYFSDTRARIYVSQTKFQTLSTALGDTPDGISVVLDYDDANAPSAATAFQVSTDLVTVSMLS